MTPQQWKITGVVTAALAIVIGSIVAIATSGGDDESIRTSGTTSSSSSTSTLPTSTSTLPPSTGPLVTVPTVTPGSTVVVPGSTTAPPTTAAPTTAAPTTAAPSTEATTTSTTEPEGSTDIGISPTEIHVAVIADDNATFDGMRAWMATVNRGGGLGGRKVRLDLRTTGSAEGYAAAVQASCENDFAIVGSFSLFDAAAGDVGCGAIPDLPVEPVAPAHAVAENAFAVFPREPAVEAVGPYKWLLANVDECCSQFWVVPDLEPDRTRTLATIDAAAAVGFETAGTVDLGDNDPPEPTYDEIAEQVVDSGATFVASGLDASSTLELRQAAIDATGVRAWFCDSSCYDPSLVADDGASLDDEYVAIETAPFSDRLEVPGVRAYLRATRRADHDPTYEGLRAFSAGLLFEHAVERIVDEHGENGLTRVHLLEALGGIDAFTADGIVGPTNVAAGAPTGCYVLLQVRDGKLARVNPDAVGSLDCGPQNLQTIGD
jgi:hypothetical protein